MKKSDQTDMRCVVRIRRYIRDLEQILEADNIKSFQDLKKSLAAKYAITQLITNIYELSDRMQDNALKNLEEFSKLRVNLKTTRQIASHDYVSIDFKPVYEVCRQLTSESVKHELSNYIEGDTDGSN